MRRLIPIILSIMLSLVPSVSRAGGTDILREAMSHKHKPIGINQLLDRVKKNNTSKVTIVKNEEELRKVEKDDKLKGELLGIDVSKWNGDINWKEVKKAGIQFAIIRAGYGKNTVDQQFERNIEGCIKNDIYVGVYWFSYAYTDDMAAKEAAFCNKVIEPYKEHIKLGVWFDFEYDSTAYATRHGVHITKDKCTDITYSFCKAIEKYGYKVGIYTNIDYANNYYTKQILEEYYVWIADWEAECRYDGKYLIWQYTDGGIVKGINGKVDMDWYYGDKR